MNALRIIPGAVGQQSIRALVLCAGQGTPQVVVRPADGSAQIPATVAALPVSSALQAELDRDGVRLFTAKATGLQPGTEYDLTAGHQGTTLIRRFRSFAPDAPGMNLKVVVASCYYDYFHRDAHYQATLKSVWCKDAAFKILVGDNLYLDVAPDQRDIEGGYRETAARYLRYFWHSGYADALGLFPTFTTWDDHEFWNNYPEWQCHLSRSGGSDRKEYMRAGQECLRAFQATLNGDLPGGDDLSYQIDDAPVVNFFAADVRSGRAPFNGGSSAMMPKESLAGFEAWTRSLTRPGVLIVGQPLWITEGDWRDYTPPNFADQYERIWRAIAAAPHDILIVSGDVHHSRILEIGLTNSRLVYEFVTSPACHIPTMKSIATGSYGSQDRGTVEAPASVPVGMGLGPALKPRFQRYLFGTDVPNTLGVLQFRSLPNGKVAVGTAFLDCLTQQPAPAKPLKIEGDTQDPVRPLCYDEELFRLS